MSVMNFRSIKLEQFGKVLLTNQKYDFGVKIGRYSVMTHKHPEIVRLLFDYFVLDQFWFRFYQSGDRLLIVDMDIYHNLRFCKIMTGKVPTKDSGSLEISLVVGK